MAVDCLQEAKLVTVYTAHSDGGVAVWRLARAGAAGHSWRLEPQLQVGGSHCLLVARLLPRPLPRLLLTGDTAGRLVARALPSLQVVGETRPHQAGLACLAVQQEEEEEEPVLVTGGDDTALAWSSLAGDSLVEGGAVPGHAAQLTGLAWAGPELLVSVGGDQRWQLWEVTSSPRLLATRCLAVADPAAVAAWWEGERLYCLVVGQGAELLAWTPVHPPLS